MSMYLRVSGPREHASSGDSGGKCMVWRCICCEMRSGACSRLFEMAMCDIFSRRIRPCMCMHC